MKGFSVSLFVVINFFSVAVALFSASRGNWNLLQQTSEQPSQLIEVVRLRDMHILADRDFTTFTGTFHAKDHYRYLLSYPCTFADATRGNNDFARKPGQAHQNQIGMP